MAAHRSHSELRRLAVAIAEKIPAPSSFFAELGFQESSFRMWVSEETRGFDRETKSWGLTVRFTDE